MTHTAVPLPTDDALVDELRRLGAVADPVPGAWRAAAVASFGWHRIEAEPARLVYDAVSGRDPRLGGVQLAGGTLRELRFTAGARTLAVELDVAADIVRVAGTVTPPAAVEVMVVWPGGLDTVTSGAAGDFRFDELPRRPVCLVVKGDAPTKTGWILV